MISIFFHFFWIDCFFFLSELCSVKREREKESPCIPSPLPRTPGTNACPPYILSINKWITTTRVSMFPVIISESISTRKQVIWWNLTIRVLNYGPTPPCLPPHSPRSLIVPALFEVLLRAFIIYVPFICNDEWST